MNDLIGMIATGAAFGLYGLYVAGWIFSYKDHLRKVRRYKKAVKNQMKAQKVAENLIVFDKTMTREHLISTWEEL